MCEDCKHLKCEKGNRWEPDEWYCELDLDEDDCEKYSEFDYQDYLDSEYDAKLRYEGAR